MTQPSPTYLLIEERLGEPLAQFVAERRPGTSWRKIAMEIFERTKIDVTYESLRTWFPPADATDDKAPGSERAA